MTLDDDVQPVAALALGEDQRLGQEEAFLPEALIFAEGERGDRLYIVAEGQSASRGFQGMGEEARPFSDAARFSARWR